MCQNVKELIVMSTHQLFFFFQCYISILLKLLLRIVTYFQKHESFIFFGFNVPEFFFFKKKLYHVIQ